MDKILSFLGLKKSFKINLDSGKMEFIRLMEKGIKPKQLFFFDIFDTNSKKYYGKIDQNGFELRRSHSTLHLESQFTKAIGKISGGDKNTIVEVTLIGWNWFILLFMFWMGLIFGLVLNDIIVKKSYGILVILIPLISIFILVPILKMRKGVKRFEKHLITELKNVQG